MRCTPEIEAVMNEKSLFPLLLVPSFEIVRDGKSIVMTKGFVSSLMRSLFSGRIVVCRNHEMPLFKVGRTALDEVFMSIAGAEKSDWARRQATLELLFGLCGSVKPEPRQWVIVADAGSVAMRNPDHLIPPDQGGPYGPPEVDLLWAEAENGSATGEKEEASPGMWAVRGEHLPMVLARWENTWNARDPGLSETEIWTQVVRELPLRAKRFEKGEVVAPRIEAVDWEAVSNAVIVTVPDWPEVEARKFLQALYFGTYLGDETGMMLNILEA